MELKEFFIPTKAKIVIFILTVILSSFTTANILSKSTLSIGFPFGVYSCYWNEPICGYSIFNTPSIIIDTHIGISSLGILLNIIFWYIISCIIAALYSRLSKKKK